MPIGWGYGPRVSKMVKSQKLPARNCRMTQVITRCVRWSGGCQRGSQEAHRGQFVAQGSSKLGYAKVSDHEQM